MTTLLLIEDDNLDAALVKRCLRATRWQIDWVQTMASAVDAIGGRSYDVVLLDVALPDLGQGEETAGLRQIRQLAPDAGVVWSGHTDMALARKMALARAVLLLDKADARTSLEGQLARALAQPRRSG